MFAILSDFQIHIFQFCIVIYHRSPTDMCANCHLFDLFGGQNLPSRSPTRLLRLNSMLLRLVAFISAFPILISGFNLPLKATTFSKRSAYLPLSKATTVASHSCLHRHSLPATVPASTVMQLGGRVGFGERQTKSGKQSPLEEGEKGKKRARFPCCGFRFALPAD